MALRWCLAATLLSAVADRFGLWGAPGSKHASWGDWQHFVAYSSTLNWYLPAALQSPVAAIATALEFGFGVSFLTGLWTRFAALGAAMLFLLFALAMTSAAGVKSPLNYSVFADAGGALLLWAILSAPPQKT